ncbi:hypothetical protein ANTQUA_LOCUS836 [Anthophora quadrimaculata]
MPELLYSKNERIFYYDQEVFFTNSATSVLMLAPTTSVPYHVYNETLSQRCYAHRILGSDITEWSRFFSGFLLAHMHYSAFTTNLIGPSFSLHSPRQTTIFVCIPSYLLFPLSITGILGNIDWCNRGVTML